MGDFFHSYVSFVFPFSFLLSHFCLFYLFCFGVCDGLYKVASGADAFLCESTFCAGETAEENHHLSAHTAAQTAKDAGVKQLFMTHYHSEQAQALLQEARRVFPDAVLTQIESTYAVGGK